MPANVLSSTRRSYLHFKPRLAALCDAARRTHRRCRDTPTPCIWWRGRPATPGRQKTGTEHPVAGVGGLVYLPALWSRPAGGESLREMCWCEEWSDGVHSVGKWVGGTNCSRFCQLERACAAPGQHMLARGACRPKTLIHFLVGSCSTSCNLLSVQAAAAS